jgi:membrane fusion protein (multidrug efflux system)
VRPELRRDDGALDGLAPLRGADPERLLRAPIVRVLVEEKVEPEGLEDLADDLCAVDGLGERRLETHVGKQRPQRFIWRGVVQVQASIPNSDSLLRSGMFAKVEVQLPVEPAQIAIPQTAINFTLYGQTVFVVTEGKDDKGQALVDAEGKPVLVAKQVVVKVGERKEEVAHILDGLKAGDQVVTAGQVRLSNDSHVKIIEDSLLNKPDTTPML